MRFRTSSLWTICLSVGVAASPVHAQDGEYLFKAHCAICHEAANREEARAPNRDVLRQMTPEHILQVLETGIMKAEGAERSRTQRRILAEYLSGKLFGASPDVVPRSRSAAAPPHRPVPRRTVRSGTAGASRSRIPAFNQPPPQV